MKNIISLGAGVQSSAMALMAKHGEITPMPEFAVFADTESEPKLVYDWLNQLEKLLPFPIYRVSQGNLYEKSLFLRTGKSGKKYTKHNVPAFTLGANGEKGMVQRQCTLDFKITPIRRKIKQMLTREERCTQWLGISLDELTRMKDSQDKRIINRYPLVEMRLTRQDCLKWMRDNNYPTPPRSACIFCPFKSKSEWLKLTEEEFKSSVAYEERMQKMFKEIGLSSVPFLSNKRVSLTRAVELDKEQGELWENECEGMCGV